MSAIDFKISEFEISKKSDFRIKKALFDFIQKPFEYKSKYLQSNYKTAFDGYSYMGQKDSLNQYYTDMLHSFVLSDFQNFDDFPIEFKDFLYEEWEDLKKLVRKVELNLINQLNSPYLTELYNSNIMGYMMSCNYYPKTEIHNKTLHQNKTRLSAHTDVSMFTTFPFGLSNGFSFFDKHENLIKVGDKNNVLIFSGYFLEFITNNKVKALNHQVDLPETLENERFSFAIFSLPKPESSFKLNGETITGKEYYKRYLGLF